MSTNAVFMEGQVISRTFSHRMDGNSFYKLLIEVQRLSSTSDILPVMVDGETKVYAGDFVRCQGEMRTHNDESNKLLIYVVASPQDGITTIPKRQSTANAVRLCGTVCRPPNYRVTPLGREVCDFIIVVSGTTGESSYIPSITWGKAARQMAKVSVGTRVSFDGRFQSRGYDKRLPDGTTEPRTAYEVSTSNFKIQIVCKPN